MEKVLVCMPKMCANPGAEFEPADDQSDSRLVNTATKHLSQLQIVVCIRDGVLCLILRNVITQGFTNMVTLPESDDFDCVTCTCIADVDWDGNNEILLGTYGQVRFVLNACTKCLTPPLVKWVATQQYKPPVFSLHLIWSGNQNHKSLFLSQP